MAAPLPVTAALNVTPEGTVSVSPLSPTVSVPDAVRGEILSVLTSLIICYLSGKLENNSPPHSFFRTFHLLSGQLPVLTFAFINIKHLHALHCMVGL